MVNCTIEMLLKSGLQILEKREYNNPFLDIQLILSYILKKDKIYLHLHKDEIVEDSVQDKFIELVNKRNTGYPLQYITGVQEFMGLEFEVIKGVLIPRADTETLVENIIKIVNTTSLKDKHINILDIGTGSGAIAVSLAYYLKNAYVVAVDLDWCCLNVAKKNSTKHNLRNIEIIKGDLFGNLNLHSRKFDIIVSNPPYIESGEIQKLQTEVSIYEPKLALDGGEDGLDFYRQIARVFKEISMENSILSVEIGYNQKLGVTKIFNNINLFKEVKIDKDLAGNDRVVTCFL